MNVLEAEEILGSQKQHKTPERKLAYAKKLYLLLDEYSKCLVVTVDNVGSKQISILRKNLRGRARFLFGKNTMVRKIIRNYIKDTGRRELASLLDLVRGNSGFVFTKGDLSALRTEIIEEKIQSAAKAGSIAPISVVIPAGATGMEPTQTAFFQAMDIPTRINRGQIDIVNSVTVVTEGTRVGASEAMLLIQLGIRPFFYGINVESVYDNGDAYDAAILDLTPDDLAKGFFSGLQQVAALSLGLNYPTLPSVPHSVLNGYKKVLCLGLACESYTWQHLEEIREVLENPDAFACAPVGGGGGDGGAVNAAPEPEPESSSSSVESDAPVGIFAMGGSSSDSDSSSD